MSKRQKPFPPFFSSRNNNSNPPFFTILEICNRKSVKNRPNLSNNVFTKPLAIIKQVIYVQLNKNRSKTMPFWRFGRKLKPRPKPYLDFTIFQLNTHIHTQTHRKQNPIPRNHELEVGIAHEGLKKPNPFVTRTHTKPTPFCKFLVPLHSFLVVD